MSIPQDVHREHILKALKQIDNESVPAARRSKRYDLCLEGRKYPPKYAISLGHKFVDGHEFPWQDFSGGDETNNFLLRQDFEIRDRRTGKLVPLHSTVENDEQAFPEGAVKFRLHRRKERSAKVVRLAKDARLQKAQDLCCDVCGFSFRERYGDLGDGFIEAHHVIPISTLKSSTKTRVEDLALVCSNCHRMLHRKRPWLQMTELKQLIRRQ